jgi:glycosyltransferase involved in cell wall biosynthesis
MMGYRFKLITRVHLYDFEDEFNGRGYLPFRYSEWKKVDAVVPISSYAHNYLRRQFGKDRKLKEVSSLGVLPTTLLNRGGTGSRFTIVSCSVLSWYKRPQLLVEIISKLEIPVKWVHFGGGALETEFLEAVNKLPAHTEFEYRGQVPNAHVLQFYKENGVDLFINVSEYEGIPYSMMEAIASGIPLVGCNVCGVPEIVTEQTGVLLPKDLEPESAAIKIAQFLKDKARDGDFRIGVQQFQQQYFNAEHNYKKFIEADLLNS